MQIFVSGSLAFDRIMDFPGKFSDHILPDKIHILNVCFMVNGVVEKFGGTAGNIAYNLALLGEKPLILATAGKDFDEYEAWLRRHGLPVHGIKRVANELTAGAYITTDKGDNQITGFNPGAMKYSSAFQFDNVAAHDAIAIVSPGNPEDMLSYSRFYKERKIPYIFDPGQQIPSLPEDDMVEMLTGAAIMIANDYELEMVEKRLGMAKTALLERCQALVITLGENGSVVYAKGAKTKIPPARAAQVLDPTGAGDAYRGGLLKGLVTKRSLVDSARMGSTCASFAVERYGTQEHSFTEQDFSARHQENFA